MSDFDFIDQGFAGGVEAESSATEALPSGQIDFVIPHVKRKPFLSNDIEYWGMAFSGGSLYLYVKSNKESVTAAGIYVDDLADDLMDGIRGRKRRKAVARALEGGLQEVLSISDYWRRLTTEEISSLVLKRRVFHFRIMFPELDGRKKFSLLARSRYRKDLVQNLEKMTSP
jgi:hypothetical protein